MNDVMALEGRGYQGFCDDSTRALVIKSVTVGKGGVKNCVTSFMDDPKGRTLEGKRLHSFFGIFSFLLSAKIIQES